MKRVLSFVSIIAVALFAYGDDGGRRSTVEPEDYYVNVHTLPDFGPGAVRGQLSG